MTHFDVLRKILAQFSADISPLMDEKSEKIEKIKKTYLPEVQKVELAKLSEEFDKKEKELRFEHIHTLAVAANTLKAQEQGKTTSRIDFDLLAEMNALDAAGIPLTKSEIGVYAERCLQSGSSFCCRKVMDLAIDFDLLAEMNALDAAGIPLTKSEIGVYAERCLQSGSSFCCRKVMDLAKKSGYKLSMPDGEAAEALIDEATERLLDVMRRFDGDTTIDSSTSVDDREVKMAASGHFLDDLEKKFKAVSVSDLTIDEIDENGKKIERKEEERKPLNFSISLDDGRESAAAQYAKDYSQRMTATPIEISGI